jgi:AcrR family transcriptional regulator
MKTAGTRNRNYPERQESILKAACGVFVRDGFHSASMKDICEAAGMSPGSLYRYYPSKEALIEALIESDRARWLAAMESLPVTEGLLPALEALAEIGLRDLEDRGFLNLWVETAAEAARNGRVANRLGESYRVLQGRLAGIIRIAQETGSIESETDPQILSCLIFAAFDGLILRATFDRDLDARALTRGFLDFIGRAVGARRPHRAKKGSR